MHDQFTPNELRNIIAACDKLRELSDQTGDLDEAVYWRKLAARAVAIREQATSSSKPRPTASEVEMEILETKKRLVRQVELKGKASAYTHFLDGKLRGLLYAAGYNYADIDILVVEALQEAEQDTDLAAYVITALAAIASNYPELEQTIEDVCYILLDANHYKEFAKMYAQLDKEPDEV